MTGRGHAITVADLFSVPTMARAGGKFLRRGGNHDPITHQPIAGNNIANDPSLHLDPAAVALLACCRRRRRGWRERR